MTKTPTGAETDESLREVFRKNLAMHTLIARTNEDNLKLFIDIELGPKNETESWPVIVSQDILNLLSETICLEFIHSDVIDDIAKTISAGEVVVRRRISKGRQAIPGRNGKIVYLVKKLGRTGEFKVDDKGIADFAVMHLFDNISEGQVVARIYPPKPGIAGKDVFGKDIPAQLGKQVEVKLDSSLTLVGDEKAEYQTLVANSKGYVREDRDSVAVCHELKVDGDLDYHFGSIDFIGKVLISGDVMPGFNISANDGIEIKGSVRGGSLVSLNGSIIVEGFVYGGHNSRVISGQTFQARIVQEVNAEIKGDIVIHVEARDSAIRTESVLKMEKGLLYGGKARVVCGAEINIMGSDVATPTAIEFCGDIETTLAFSQLKVRITNHEKAIKLINLHLGPYGQDREKISSLRDNHRTKIEDLVRKLDKLSAGLSLLEERKKSIIHHAKKNMVKRVNILGKMYPGSQIIVADKNFTPPSMLTGPVSIDFNDETLDFVQGELKGLECTYNDPNLENASKIDDNPSETEKVEDKDLESTE